MDEVEVLETPVKSESDKREYRLIKLPNGLKAILIKEFIDKTSEQSQSKDIAAASLAVNIGTFDDPKNAMGLAHFLEHIVFMGSEKYPIENSFYDFLQANNGSDNAMTSSEVTCFFFQVNEKAFPQALDIYAQQFISPLLLKNTMQREREAVDSEFKMALSVDAVMEESLYKTMIYESHPASQFECGNLKTLKEEISDDDLHAELFKLHSKYVGNKMFLAVQSSRSLDDLQDLVVNCFSSVKKGEVDPSKLPPAINEIFKPDFFNKLYFLKPKTVQKSLTIAWALPSVLKVYKSSPLRYISRIFDNKGDGGIARYLIDAHLITSIRFFIHSNTFSGNSQFCLPRCRVDLTDLGLQHIEKVLEAIFSYLLMIKETSIEEHRRLFHEYKEKNETFWKFSTGSGALSNVQKLMTPMMLFEDQDILRGEPLVFIEFDEEIISGFIESLNQRKFNIIISDSDREIYTKKEKYFFAEYDEQDFPVAYQKLWDERQLNPDFFLEKSNPFKATNFELFVNEEESPKYPVKVYSDEVYEVWHKLDNKYERPKASVYINFLSPKQVNSTRNYLYLKIYDAIITRFFNKKYSQAMSANLDVDSNVLDKSMTLSFSGFNEKIETLIEMVAADMKAFNRIMYPEIFETIKAQMKKQYFNYLRNVDAINREFLNEILFDNFYHDNELLHEIDNITFENLQKHLLKFFSKLKIHVLVQGNIRKSQALNVVRILKENFVCQPLDNPYKLREQVYQLPLGTSVLRVKSLNISDDNSSIKNYYQIGPETLRLRSLLKLLESILDSKAFDYLRNKEQLGYNVGIGMQGSSGVLGLKLYVSSQEHKHSFKKVYGKLETFMNEIAKNHIEALTDEEFEQFKESRIKMLVADYSSLAEEIHANWNEITREDYVFDRKELTVKVTKALTKTELQDFFRSFTQPENMRKISIQVIGNESSDEITDKDRKSEIIFMTEKMSEDENVLKDLPEFQSPLILYPNVKFEIS